MKFIQKAMTVGPNTADVIQAVLKSRKLEVQTYRMCMGILNFASKYSKEILEESCRLAIESSRPTYSFVKNTISTIAKDYQSKVEKTSSLNEERNRGAFVMASNVMDVNNLLSRSESLARMAEKEACDDEI